VSKVCWSVNMSNLGTRQWWEVAVMPVGHTELVANVPASDAGAQVDLYPDPAYDVASWSGVNGWAGKPAINGSADWQGVQSGTDLATRYPACFTDNKNGTLSVFKSHAYTPQKDNPPLIGRTWHWDEIQVTG
jgi:hypothetical protein